MPKSANLTEFVSRNCLNDAVQIPTEFLEVARKMAIESNFPDLLGGGTIYWYPSGKIAGFGMIIENYN